MSMGQHWSSHRSGSPILNCPHCGNPAEDMGLGEFRCAGPREHDFTATYRFRCARCIEDSARMWPSVNPQCPNGHGPMSLVGAGGRA